MEDNPAHRQRRSVIDSACNRIMGDLATYGNTMLPDSYLELLKEVYDRIAWSLDYINEGRVKIEEKLSELGYTLIEDVKN